MCTAYTGLGIVSLMRCAGGLREAAAPERRGCWRRRRLGLVAMGAAGSAVGSGGTGAGSTARVASVHGTTTTSALAAASGTKTRCRGGPRNVGPQKSAAAAAARHAFLTSGGESQRTFHS
eukprot:COSAG01_NODE_55_length_31115_cov_105.202533_9_plen_120_part_00